MWCRGCNGLRCGVGIATDYGTRLTLVGPSYEVGKLCRNACERRREACPTDVVELARRAVVAAVHLSSEMGTVSMDCSGGRLPMDTAGDPLPGQALLRPLLFGRRVPAGHRTLADTPGRLLFAGMPSCRVAPSSHRSGTTYRPVPSSNLFPRP